MAGPTARNFLSRFVLYEEKEGKEECVIGGYPSIAMDNTL